ncbi:MAG: DUF3883 domain-containing protein [Brevundimonas sp.]|nr:MAG: DUF3883 domain-containing protein [Brevundimonas sp.]
MLALDAAGQSFVKAHRNRALVAETGRSHKSVEFKHMNISAVTTELGLPTVRGYRPMSNYQAAIFPAIDRYLSAHGDAWAIGDLRLFPHPTQPPCPAWQRDRLPFRSHSMERSGPELAALALSDVPTLGSPRPAPLQRLIRKFDPAAKDAANRRLGLSGERRIYNHEIARLIAADRMDLAKRVEWTSQAHGDGAGYDIRSFDPPSGDDRFIEVKSTKGGARTDFFLSRNERAFSEEEPDRYRLYRLYDAANDPKLFALKPPLEEAVHLSTETWRAGF